MERRFRRIYRFNLWRGGESSCGPGSGLEETAAIREELPTIIRSHNVRSLLDIPCGDFWWMNRLDLGLDSYIGGDVVSGLVHSNEERYGGPGRSFRRLDILSDRLPRVDLVLCRDCLDHFSLNDVQLAIGNIVRSGSTLLLVTTYPRTGSAIDIRTGDWRPLNLQQPPFAFPEPIMMVNERSKKRGFPDKSLALWRIADLPGAHRDPPLA